MSDPDLMRDLVTKAETERDRAIARSKAAEAELSDLRWLVGHIAVNGIGMLPPRLVPVVAEAARSFDASQFTVAPVDPLVALGAPVPGGGEPQPGTDDEGICTCLRPYADGHLPACPSFVRPVAVGDQPDTPCPSAAPMADPIRSFRQYQERYLPSTIAKPETAEQIGERIAREALAAAEAARSVAVGDQPDTPCHLCDDTGQYPPPGAGASAFPRPCPACTDQENPDA